MVEAEEGEEGNSNAGVQVTRQRERDSESRCDERISRDEHPVPTAARPEVSSSHAGEGLEPEEDARPHKPEAGEHISAERSGERRRGATVRS